jgi:hypothetical protein
MKIKTILVILLLTFSAAAINADVVVLRDGKSYSGTYTGLATGQLSFQDSQGIQYTFPMRDVQSLAFSDAGVHISLRNGQTYSGQLIGVDRLAFQGPNGVSYIFPIKAVSSLVLIGAPASSPNTPPVSVPVGTPIVVRTAAPIDSSKDAAGKLYPAQIEQNVLDDTGAVAIPAGTQANLRVVAINSGGATKGQDLTLDLDSVNLNGKQYRVDTSSVTEGSQSNVGMNRKTAEYAAGGGVLGVVLGGVFGGGRGAGIGAAAGAGGGVLTQLFTHGQKVKVPAESTLTFQLTQALVHP